MKGTLTKTDRGWVVNYDYSINKNDWETLPLHADFIEMMDTCFTSKFTHEIEFEIVTEWENGEVGVNGLTYAKLINHIPDTGKKVEDDVVRLAEEEFPINMQPKGRTLAGGYYDVDVNFMERRAFTKGYTKAKESLYTEEQVRKAYEYGSNASLGISKTNLINHLKNERTNSN